jgi:hypothetical protein
LKIISIDFQKGNFQRGKMDGSTLLIVLVIFGVKKLLEIAAVWRPGLET